MNPWNACIWVFVGSGLGGVARFLLSAAIDAKMKSDFPWGTFAVNVAGSALIGAAAAYFAHHSGTSWAETAKLFLIIGVLGGFTTFSSYSLQTVQLIQNGHLPIASGYVILSAATCLLGTLVGLLSIKLFLP